MSQPPMPDWFDRPLPWLRLRTDAPPAEATHLQGQARVRGQACRSRAGLFAEWAARLHFPAYFGHNWDALADCLTDLVDQAPLTLVVDDAVQLLADEPPAQLTTLLTVLGGAAEGLPGRLEVVLCCEPADEDALRQRITAAAPRG